MDEHGEWVNKVYRMLPEYIQEEYGRNKLWSMELIIEKYVEAAAKKGVELSD